VFFAHKIHLFRCGMGKYMLLQALTGNTGIRKNQLAGALGRLFPVVGILLFLAVGTQAWGQVTALANTGYTTGTGGARESLDGVVLSPFFNVTAGATPLYVYNAEVRSVDFASFTSYLTGSNYHPSDLNQNWVTTANPTGQEASYSADVGTASFTSFQLNGTTTILVTFQAGFPVGGTLTAGTFPINSASSQVKILSRVTDNIGPVTVYGAGNALCCPAGSFSFSVTQQVDASGNGIPQQLTIEIGGDWMNPLNIFINPAPTVANGPPSGAYVFTPPTGSTTMNINQSTFSNLPGYTAYRFTHGVYNVTSGLNFGSGIELYLDDGAFLNYTGAANNISGQTYGAVMIGMGGWPLNDVPAIIRGWGVLDGQEMQTQMLNDSAHEVCTAAEQVTAPMCESPTNAAQSPSGVTLGTCASSTMILAINDMTTSIQGQVLVDGITLRNSCAWNFGIGKNIGSPTNPVTVNNIKIFGHSGAGAPGESNSDGIDASSNQYLNITNSFFRTDDDLISLKADYTGAGTTSQNHVNVVGNTFFNEYAHAMVVGEELGNSADGYSDQNIVFDSNYVVHDTGKGQVMGISDVYGGTVNNVTFSNIQVDQAFGLLSIEMAPSTMTNFTGYITGNTLTVTTAGSAALVVNYAITGTGVPANTIITALGTGTGGTGTYTLNNSVSTTTATETMTATTLPGIVEGNILFCNINMTSNQDVLPDLVGAGQSTYEPWVNPVPNIQMAISLSGPSTYAGTPQSIQTAPIFSNVTVNGSPVTTSTPGNDFYYQNSTGWAPGTPMPQNEVELTVRQRNGVSGAVGSIWSYNQSQIAEDMMSPVFTTVACPVSPILQVAVQITPTVSVWPTATPLTYGQSLSASTLSGGTASTPGTFAFSAPTTVPSAGNATQVVVFTPTDTVDYKTVTGNVSVTVSPVTPNVSWTTPASIAYGTPLSTTQLDATAVDGSGNTIAGTFTYKVGTATLSIGQVLNASTYTVVATFTPSSTNYVSGKTATVSLTVTKIASATIVSTSGNPVVVNTNVTLTALVQASGSGVPTGTVSFYDGTTLLGSGTLNTSGVATYTTSALALGSHSISAVYAGDPNFTGSTSSSSVTLLVTTATDFTFVVTGSSSQVVLAGNAASFQSQIAPITGTFTTPVVFSATGLPTGATATFAPATIAAGSGSTAVSITIQTVAVAANHDRQRMYRADMSMLSVLLLPLLTIGRRVRKGLLRRSLVWVVPVLIFAGMASLTGCGGGSSSKAGAVANYTVTVIAASSGFQHSFNVNLGVQ